MLRPGQEIRRIVFGLLSATLLFAALILGSPSAVADSCDSGCAWNQPTMLWPPDQSEVPPNARILAHNGFTVLETEAGEQVPAQLEQANFLYSWVTPATELEVGVRYHLRADEGDYTSDGSFLVVGDRDTQPPTGLQLEVVDAHRTCGTFVNFDLIVGLADEPAILLELWSDEDTLLIVTEPGFHIRDCLHDGTERIGVQAVAYDLAGNPSEPAAATIYAPDQGGVCSLGALRSARVPPVLFLVMGLVAVVIMRRRWRTSTQE